MKYTNTLGTEIDEKYINENNREFCYAHVIDKEVKERKKRVRKNRGKKGRYDLTHAKQLSSNLYDKTLLPWGLEIFIIVLIEIDPENKTKWKDRAVKLLVKFHEFDFDRETRKYTKKISS